MVLEQISEAIVSLARKYCAKMTIPLAPLNIHHPLVVSLLKFHQALEALACENQSVSERRKLMHTHYALNGFVVVVATVFILVVIHHSATMCRGDQGSTPLSFRTSHSEAE